LQGERSLDTIFDTKIDNEFFEERHIPMDVDKFATNYLVLEHTLIPA
jgi:hypothetical protein